MDVIMYTVYALVFIDGDVYIGMTQDLCKRIARHKRGCTRSTKNRKICRVLRIEICLNRREAREREIYWKSGCGKERLKQFIYSGVEQPGSSSGS